MLTDASGVPVGVAVAGANRHDVMLLEATLASIPVPRPRPTRRKPQGVCLDKAYDITWVYRLLTDAGYTPHVRAVREDILARRLRTSRSSAPAYWDRILERVSKPWGALFQPILWLRATASGRSEQ